jgi:hypothetical protein
MREETHRQGSETLARSTHACCFPGNGEAADTHPEIRYSKETLP